MNERLNKSLLFMEKNWHMPDSVFERVSEPCMSAIRTIFFNGEPVFQDREPRLECGLAVEKYLSCAVTHRLTYFDKNLFCGPSSNPHHIIPGPRKGRGRRIRGYFRLAGGYWIGRGLVCRLGVLIVGVNHSSLSDFALRLRLDCWILVYIQIAFGITQNQTDV